MLAAHFDVVRHLEVCELPGGEALHVLDADRHAGGGMHHHRELLAPGLVGHAEGGDLVDLGAFEDRALDLGGIDVLAATDDQVLGTVRQEQVAIVVEVTDVTAVEPAVAEFGLVGFGAIRSALRAQRDPLSRGGQFLAQLSGALVQEGSIGNDSSAFLAGV